MKPPHTSEGSRKKRGGGLRKTPSTSTSAALREVAKKDKSQRSLLKPASAASLKPKEHLKKDKATRAAAVAIAVRQSTKGDTPEGKAKSIFSSKYGADAVVDTEAAVAANPFQPSAAVRELTSSASVALPVNPITIDLSLPKEIMSKAQRRALKKPLVSVTKEMKEAAREAKKEDRRMKRILKSNGSRRKIAKLAAKREREELTASEEAVQALDMDYQPRSKGRRLE